jgi:hypothetical protein
MKNNQYKRKRKDTTDSVRLGWAHAITCRVIQQLIGLKMESESKA